MRPIDYLVLAVILALAALAARYVWRHRGKCGGCQGCAGCSRQNCAKRREEEEQRSDEK